MYLSYNKAEHNANTYGSLTLAKPDMSHKPTNQPLIGDAYSLKFSLQKQMPINSSENYEKTYFSTTANNNNPNHSNITMKSLPQQTYDKNEDSEKSILQTEKSMAKTESQEQIFLPTTGDNNKSKQSNLILSTPSNLLQKTQPSELFKDNKYSILINLPGQMLIPSSKKSRPNIHCYYRK